MYMRKLYKIIRHKRRETATPFSSFNYLYFLKKTFSSFWSNPILILYWFLTSRCRVVYTIHENENQFQWTISLWRRLKFVWSVLWISIKKKFWPLHYHNRDQHDVYLWQLIGSNATPYWLQTFCKHFQIVKSINLQWYHWLKILFCFSYRKHCVWAIDFNFPFQTNDMFIFIWQSIFIQK